MVKVCHELCRLWKGLHPWALSPSRPSDWMWQNRTCPAVFPESQVAVLTEILSSVMVGVRLQEEEPKKQENNRNWRYLCEAPEVAPGGLNVCKRIKICLTPQWGKSFNVLLRWTSAVPQTAVGHAGGVVATKSHIWGEWWLSGLRGGPQLWAP